MLITLLTLRPPHPFNEFMRRNINEFMWRNIKYPPHSSSLSCGGISFTV
jgi:hypothetical protein